jgi:hypothetical protein
MKYLLLNQGRSLNLDVILYPRTQEIVLVCALSKANGYMLQPLSLQPQNCHSFISLAAEGCLAGLPNRHI